MKNKKGFTLIEIMVVIGISAVLALITVPSMMKWYQKDKFINQASEIINIINEARTSALSEKKCSSDNLSNFWRVEINEDTFRLLCSYGSGSSDEESSITITSPTQLNTMNASIQGGSLNHPISSAVFIDFPSGSAYSHIYLTEFLVLIEQIDVKKISIPLVFTENTDIKRTICFDRVAGFPTMSNDINCAD